ncbi:hypothetical protein MYFR107205_10465 [Mycolicibacterium frederiksbergense]
MTSAIGLPVDRIEGRDKVTGAARYAADTVIDGVVHGVLVQSTIAKGHVTADSMTAAAAAAAAAPGVLHVLTPLNCPPLHVLPVDMTWDLPLERRPPLSDLSVQHVGQHLAVVIAETPEQAADAASLMSFDYVHGSAQLTAVDVLGAPVPADEKDGQIRYGTYRPDHFVKLDEEKLQDSRGAADEPDGIRVAARFTTPVNAHYPIELSATVAHWDGDMLTVHDSTRWITGERRALAPIWVSPRTGCGYCPHWSAARSGRRASCGCMWCCVRWPPGRSAGRSNWCSPATRCSAPPGTGPAPNSRWRWWPEPMAAC